MSVIVGLLNGYGTIALKLAAVEAKIKAVAGDLLIEKSSLEKQLEASKAEIKDKAKFIPDSQAHTLKGESYQLVWRSSNGFDASKVEALLEKYNKLSGESITLTSLKAEGGWALKENGKGGK